MAAVDKWSKPYLDVRISILNTYNNTLCKLNKHSLTTKSHASIKIFINARLLLDIKINKNGNESVFDQIT